MLATASTIPASAAPNPSTPFEHRAHDRAIEFEGVFLSMMVKEMFKGVQEQSEFSGGFGEEMFQGLMAEQYAKSIAESGGIGLSDQIYREFLARQEV